MRESKRDCTWGLVAPVVFTVWSVVGAPIPTAAFPNPDACADINGTGLVTEADLGIASIYWGETAPPAPPQVDQDLDGDVDILDLQFVAGRIGTTADCQDQPLQCIDVNGTGLVTQTDFQIAAHYWPQTVPPAPSVVDINGDGEIDILDLQSIAGRVGTQLQIACQEGAPIIHVCSNELDDDGDGLADHPNDPGCANVLGELENPQCNDGVDNDGDGQVDLADSDCAQASDVRELPDIWCGMGMELVLLLPPLLWLRRRIGRSSAWKAGSDLPRT